MEHRWTFVSCGKAGFAPAGKSFRRRRVSRQYARKARVASLPLKTILLVCNRDDSRIALKWFLTDSGYVIDCVRNTEEAMAVFHPVIHDLVVTEDSMAGMTGAELAQIIKLRSPNTPVVMYAGKPPSDSSCLDLVIKRSAHMLILKVGIDMILAGC
jgi:CheY-like chemotaxis protein